MSINLQGGDAHGGDGTADGDGGDATGGYVYVGELDHGTDEAELARNRVLETEHYSRFATFVAWCLVVVLALAVAVMCGVDIDVFGVSVEGR